MEKVFPLLFYLLNLSKCKDEAERTAEREKVGDFKVKGDSVGSVAVAVAASEEFWTGLLRVTVWGQGRG